MVSDKDGGVREYTARLQVTATYSSLCELVRSYSDDQQVAEQLCQRLDQAEKAANPIAKDVHLAAFRDRVDKSGVFTRAEADMLKRLSTSL